VDRWRLPEKQLAALSSTRLMTARPRRRRGREGPGAGGAGQAVGAGTSGDAAVPARPVRAAGRPRGRAPWARSRGLNAPTEPQRCG